MMRRAERQEGEEKKMGNKIAKTSQASASEYYLHYLPSSFNLVLKEVLGRGRFFKSILCKLDEGLVLVKVYFKRGDSNDLREYKRRLSHIQDIFRALDHPPCLAFSDKAAYLLRQYFFNNLHDRLSTRPFLSLIEKKWLAFQLLYAVKQSHENGVCHGDIKCENVMVTSWNWLYLADFASFKPTYIPDDDPSDFSFFFDTGGRRLCYLAPERFFEHGGEIQVVQDALLGPSMDIFAVGPDRSYFICGPTLNGVGNDDFFETKSSFGVQVVQETKRHPLATKLTSKAVLAAAATDSAGCHCDSVLSLASVKLNQRLLISSSRDGAIKVWK